MADLSFKSTPDNFAEEKSGLKAYTIRDIEESDERHKLLFIGNPKTIEIRNTETGEWFTRTILRKLHWPKRLIGVHPVHTWVISWDGQEKNEGERKY